MPEISVVIKYDTPEDPFWLNPDNVALCLHAYCLTTKFEVSWATNGNPWAVHDTKTISGNSWSNIDPREVFTNSTVDIVIVRPGLGGRKYKLTGTGRVDTNHGYLIMTSFDDYETIGPNDNWDISWKWIIAE